MTIAIFAREPIPGRTKTRLAASIGDDAACRLHRAFVRDTIARCTGLAPLVELHAADPGAFLSSLGLPVVAQIEGDLGARMAHALGRARLIVGSDAPTLPRATITAALAALEHRDVVLTPAADGGYVIVGARREPGFLRDPAIRWSSRHALADTLRAARARRLSVALTAPHHDVDHADDLRLLRAHLALDPSAAPHTASAIGGLIAEVR